MDLWSTYSSDMNHPAFAFDSHKFVKRLKDNGFTEQQAEVLAEEQVAMLDRNLVHLATKSDLKDLEIRLIKWMVGIAGAIIGTLIAVLKFL